MVDLSAITNLFSQDDLMPHGICLVWRPELIWLHGVSDLLTALAYYSIPFALAVFAWRRRDLKFRWMFVLFGLFILACGTTHMLALWTLWVPDYGVQGVAKAVTAAVSVATAGLLWPLIPKALAVPSPSQLEVMNVQLRDEVSERQAAEGEVRRLNQDLERRVDVRTGELRLANDRLVALNASLRREIEARKRTEADLRAAKEQAEQADQAKSRFMAAASHDLRQPVQALVFLIDGVARRVQGQAAVAPLLDSMRSSVEGLQRLLEGLLDLSRLDAGAVEARPRPVPLRDLFSRLRAEYEPVARARGLRLRFVPTSLACVSDPALLERVLRNLVENAIRYTEHGGVVVGCRRRGGGVGLQVVDTGIGIPADQQRAIFQEFYQVGNPERDRRKGLGLGLSIVQRLTAILGHQVSVTSRPGRGSCFTVAMASCGTDEGLPVPARGAWMADPEEPDGLPASVMVIEDESTVRLGLDLMIRGWGCDVLMAADEDEAVALVDPAAPPQVIVADYRLREGRTGIAAIGRVRALAGRPIPAALLTGDIGADVSAAAKAEGLTLVAKPVSAEQLREALRALNSPPAPETPGTPGA